MNKCFLKKLNMILFIVLIAGTVAFLAIGTYLNKPEEYSIFENRNLSQEPLFNFESLQNGSYFTDSEKYISDKIVGRDTWLEYSTLYQMNVLKRPVVNDVVITDDVLLPYINTGYPDVASDESVNDMTDKLEHLNSVISENGGKFIYIGVPCQTEVFKDETPEITASDCDYLIATEEKFFESLEEKNIDYIAAKDVFAANGEVTDYYLKTDHHYRLEGAYLLYKAMCEKATELGVQATSLDESEFEFSTLPNPFYGSRSRKFYNVSPITESLSIFKLKNEIPFTRINNGTLSPSLLFNIPEDTNEKIDYTMYMYGDIAETIIKTDRPELPNILIFGDSYTNAVECFSYLSFNEMRSLDLRQYSKKTLSEYIEEYKPDLVVCIRDSSMYISSDGNGNIS